jgi:hypothetical protein
MRIYYATNLSSIKSRYLNIFCQINGYSRIFNLLLPQQEKYQEVYGDNDNYLEEKRKKAKAAKALIEKESLYLTQPSQAGGVNTPRGGGGVNTPRAGTNKNIPALQQA